MIHLTYGERDFVQSRITNLRVLKSLAAIITLTFILFVYFRIPTPIAAIFLVVQVLVIIILNRKEKEYVEPFFGQLNPDYKILEYKSHLNPRMLFSNGFILFILLISLMNILPFSKEFKDGFGALYILGLFTLSRIIAGFEDNYNYHYLTPDGIKRAGANFDLLPWAEVSGIEDYPEKEFFDIMLKKGGYIRIGYGPYYLGDYTAPFLMKHINEKMETAPTS